MAKTIVHETMHEMLAYDLLMDAGGDIDKAMARFKAEMLTPPTADELNSAREYMERTRLNARPARYGAAELIRGDRALDRGAHQAGEVGMKAPSKAQIEKIESILVMPGDTDKEPTNVEIMFEPGSYDLAVEFARWLSAVTGKSATVFKRDSNDYTTLG